jgi:rhamnosyltransferase subunit B
MSEIEVYADEIEQVGTGKDRRVFLLLTLGSLGDIRPFLALGTALHNAGCQVHLMTTPNFQPLVEGAGLIFEPFGTIEQYEAVFQNPETWNPNRPLEIVWSELMVPNLERVRQWMTSFRTIADVTVMTHSIMFPFVDLARADGMKRRVWLVSLYPATFRASSDHIALGPIQIPAWIPASWKQRIWRWLDEKYMNPILNPAINQAREACGLSQISSFFNHVQRDPDGLLMLYPDWYSNHRPDGAKQLFQAGFFRYKKNTTADVPHLDEALQDFLRASNKPVVAFSAGSENRHADVFYRRAIEAVQRLQIRGVMVTTQQGLLPKQLPDDVIWRASVPFDALFPQVAVVVHHGGIGTLAEAFHAGVPQLIVPFAYDQFDNAMRIRAAGCGEMLAARQLTYMPMHRTLRKLLIHQRYRSSAERVQTQIQAERSPDEWVSAFLHEH